MIGGWTRARWQSIRQTGAPSCSHSSESLRRGRDLFRSEYRCSPLPTLPIPDSHAVGGAHRQRPDPLSGAYFQNFAGNRQRFWLSVVTSNALAEKNRCNRIASG